MAQFSGIVGVGNSEPNLRPVEKEKPSLVALRPRRVSRPGIQVHIVTPRLPPPNNVKNPSVVGLSATAVFGRRLIHPSPARVCAPVVSEHPFRSFPNTDSGVSEHPGLEACSAGVS